MFIARGQMRSTVSSRGALMFFEVDRAKWSVPASQTRSRAFQIGLGQVRYRNSRLLSELFEQDGFALHHRLDASAPMFGQAPRLRCRWVTTPTRFARVVYKGQPVVDQPLISRQASATPGE